MKTWRGGWWGIVLTDHKNRAGDGRACDEPGPTGYVVLVGLFGDGKKVCNMFVVVVGCPSEGGLVEGAVGTVSWSNDVEALNKGELFDGWDGGGRRQLSETENEDEFADTDDGTRIRKAGVGDEDVRKSGILERAGG